MGWYRHPKTTQERRINGKRNIINYDDYEVNVRPSRNFANLVEYRDDIPKTNHYDRSWKRYRKTQYKPRDVGEKSLGKMIVEGLEEFLYDLKHGILGKKYRITTCQICDKADLGIKPTKAELDLD